MFTSLANALAFALSIWNHEQKTLFQRQLMDLKRKYYEEQNKPADRRDDAVLDHLEFELRLLCDSLCSGLSQPNSPDQP
jgi:hypothetical protein